MKLKGMLKLPIIATVNKIREIYYRGGIEKLADGDYFIKYNMPIFTQWESRELVEDIIGGKIDCKNDPLWKDSGAKNQEEYEMYSWQVCGMACLKMILKSICPDKNYRTVELAKDAEKYGVYIRNKNENRKHNLDGMLHSQFLKFIRKFNLNGVRKIYIKENYIAHLLLGNYYIIASVHPSIREDVYANNSKSGHLILIKGFRVKNGKVSGFFINNPSGYLSNMSQENYFVSLEKWRNYFSGNIDVINL